MNYLKLVSGTLIALSVVGGAIAQDFQKVVSNTVVNQETQKAGVKETVVTPYNISAVDADSHIVDIQFSALKSLKVGHNVNFPLPLGLDFHGQVKSMKSVVPGVESAVIKGEAGYAIISRAGPSSTFLINAYERRYRVESNKGHYRLKEDSQPRFNNQQSDVLTKPVWLKEKAFTKRQSESVTNSDERATIEDGKAIIDVFFLIDTRTNELYEGGARPRLAEYIIETNLAFENSGADLRINALRVEDIKLPELKTSDTLSYIAGDDKFKSIRDVASSIGADLVSALVSTQSDEYCGIAYMGGYDGGKYEQYPEFSVSEIVCGASTLAHELGHNLGLGHSRAQGSLGASYPFALGHGIRGDFHTLMAYRSAYYMTGSQLESKMLFSNPELDCNGSPCGVAHEGDLTIDDGKGADAVRALNLVAYKASGNLIRISDPEGNSFDSAQDLAGGDTVDAWIDHAGDIDFYRITLDDTSSVYLDADTPMEFRVYDANGVLLDRTQGEQVDINLLQGSYYLEVRHSKPLDITNYKFSYRQESENPTLVPTQFRFKAAGVEKIVDYYSGQSCQVDGGVCEINTLANMPVLAQFDINENFRLASISDCEKYKPYDCLRRSGDVIDIELELIPFDDRAGDTFGDARQVPLNKYIQQSLPHRFDTDILSFSVLERKDLTLYVQNFDNIKVELYDRKLELLQAFEGPSQNLDLSGRTALRLRELGPGRFYLKFTISDKAERDSGWASFVLGETGKKASLRVDVDSHPIDDVNYYIVPGGRGYYTNEGGTEYFVLEGPDGIELALSLSSVEGKVVRATNCDRFSFGFCEFKNVTGTVEVNVESYQDADLDGVPDEWVEKFGRDIGGPNSDPDEDLLANREEFIANSNPLEPDTDGDGLPDEFEYGDVTHPNIAEDAHWDEDGDWISNIDEYALRTHTHWPRYPSSNLSDTSIAARKGERLKPSGVSFDFDGDDLADHNFYDPKTGEFHIIASGLNRTIVVETGIMNGVPAPADYDGDGLTDVAVMDPQKGIWFIRQSFLAVEQHIWLGTREEDIPVPADYDGDGRADPTIRRPSEGFWAIQRSSDAIREFVYFGKQSTDLPLAADMNGDGYDDFIIRRPHTGDWYVKDAVSGDIKKWFLGREVTDIPFVMDYNGDGINEFAIRRLGSSKWFIKELETNEVTEVDFGKQLFDIPAIYDVDGDGSDDLVIGRGFDIGFYWRPVFDYSGVNYDRVWLTNPFIPGAAPLMYRMPSSVPWGPNTQTGRKVTPTSEKFNGNDI